MRLCIFQHQQKVAEEVESRLVDPEKHVVGFVVSSKSEKKRALILIESSVLKLWV